MHRLDCLKDTPYFGCPLYQLADSSVMADDSPILSRSVEDYLKAIYSLSHEGEAASTSSIAVALDVQPASVSGMVKIGRAHV